VYSDDDHDSVETAQCTLDELFDVRARVADTPDTCVLVANKCDQLWWAYEHIHVTCDTHSDVDNNKLPATLDAHIARMSPTAQAAIVCAHTSARTGAGVRALFETIARRSGHLPPLAMLAANSVTATTKMSKD
jgi:GTPase SAR1 family protein